MATQGQALKAYRALNGMGKKATGRAAFILFRVKQQLKPIIDFQAEEEEKMVEKCGGQITEAGTILFADPEKRKEYTDVRTELDGLAIEPEIQKVTMKIKDLPDISLDEVEALADFIDFEEG